MNKTLGADLCKNRYAGWRVILQSPDRSHSSADRVLREVLPADQFSLLGEGPPCLVVNGGPGLSKSYIVDGLKFVADSHACIVYDQLGCFDQKEFVVPPTLADTIDQFIRIAQQIKKCGFTSGSVIAHSWGAYLILRALVEHPDLLDWAGKIVFVAPMPTRSEDRAAAEAILASRLLPGELAELGQLMQGESFSEGRRLMNLLLPAYSGSRERQPTMPLEMHLTTYKSVMATVSDTDLSPGFRVLSGRLSVVIGSDDFIRPEHVADYVAASAQTVLLQNTGHFPFAEDPVSFRAALKTLLNVPD